MKDPIGRKVLEGKVTMRKGATLYDVIYNGVNIVAGRVDKQGMQEIRRIRKAAKAANESVYSVVVNGIPVTVKEQW